MAVLSCVVLDRTLAILFAYGEAHGRSVEDLAEAAISEAAIAALGSGHVTEGDLTLPTLFVFASVRDADDQYPRRLRQARHVVFTSTYLESSGPAALSGRRFWAAHIFTPLSGRALALIEGTLLSAGRSRGDLHDPGRPDAIPQGGAA